MDWIAHQRRDFRRRDALIERRGAAVYGRATYDMMRGYWPTLLDKPDSPRSAPCPLGGADSQAHLFAHHAGSDWNNVHIRRDAKDILR